MESNWYAIMMTKVSEVNRRLGGDGFGFRGRSLLCPPRIRYFLILRAQKLLVMNKILRIVGHYTLYSEAIHPELGIIKLGDNVVLKDDHIINGSGKGYIEEVKIMFSYDKNPQIFIIGEDYKDSAFRRSHWASRPTGRYIQEIKTKLSDKELKAINKARSLLRNYF